MKSSFEYSTLYYQRSQLSEERFAIGLLFFFPIEKEIAFVAPASLQKLSSFLVDFDTNYIRKIFKRFGTTANKITKDLNASDIALFKVGLQELISTEFLVSDSSALYFSLPKAGITSDKEAIKTYYQSIYFKNYLFNSSDNRINEAKILSKFNHLFKSRIITTNKILDEQVIVEGEYFPEKFEYGWQNGKYNLVSPISFDLEKADTIKKKCQQQIGVLSNLNNAIKENNYSINYILAKPSQKSLYSAYDNALAIIEEFQKKSITRIIDFNSGIAQYIEEINDTAKPLL